MSESGFKPLSDALNKLTSKVESQRKTKKGTEENLPTTAQLELWPEHVRGVPNAALRGSLFGISKTRATAKKRTLLATLAGIEILFKGEKFNQRDLDTWEMLLHLAREQPLGNKVTFKANAILKALGRPTSGDQHELLKEEITRLRSGTVEIKWTDTEKVFGGGLVSNYFRDEITDEWVVVFDEKMLSLYDKGFTHVNWEQRQLLRHNSLAQWVHGFYASHAEPYDYKVATLKTLSGSTVARLGDFRKQLRIALDAVKEVGGILDWGISKEDDLVYVKKMPSNSQKKHLQRKRTQGKKA